MKLEKIFPSVLAPALIFGIALNVLIWNISTPAHEYFDEVHYVSAARQIAELRTNENWTQPPLGKELIALGIKIAGDKPLGWRLASVFFGALTIVAFYFWGLFLFRDEASASIVALLTLVNQFHFIQSRMAMLDVFMVFFIAVGMAAFTYLYMHSASLAETRTRLILYGSGVAFGLATAAKWLGVVAAMICLCLLIARRSFGLLSERMFLGVTCFVIAPPIFYALAYVVLLAMSPPQPGAVRVGLLKIPQTIEASVYSAPEVVKMQFEMFKAQLNFANPKHPYTSQWWSWPVMLQPIWYEHRTARIDDREQASVVLLIGNPFIVWLGLIAMAICFWLWLRHRDDAAMIISLTFLSLWLIWAILPRNVGFLYYYYPPAQILSLALVRSARAIKVPRLVAAIYLLVCVAWFVYFIPVITGQFYPIEVIEQRLMFFFRP